MPPSGLVQVPSLERQGHSIRVMVTRPEREARVWAAALQSKGIDCETLPLIQIAALPEASVLASVWAGVPSHLALMFVSANAVRFFMAARPAAQPMPTCRAWSTGPGTDSALLAAGWPAELIDSPDANSPQFDSEALWQKVQERVDLAVHQCPSKPSVLIVRGADAQGQLAGRDWLARQLMSAGLEVSQTVAYARQAPALDSAQRHRIEKALAEGAWWLFSSSEAAQHLLESCPDLPWSQARAFATHPRIAQRLQAAGWGCVQTVPASLEAQAVSIKSWA
ncbi:MAG: hydroxymethylbilane hydrolyase [Comamonadaceae bacterium PBBC1]|nr:MAG: hydroxymethylbilane hydrolyase [Comamonadaceae bacterium PBBC1]